MQEQPNTAKTSSKGEDAAMAKAVAYYEWCVTNGRTAVGSGADDEEHRHYMWISKYKAAVRGVDYCHA